MQLPFSILLEIWSRCLCQVPQSFAFELEVKERTIVPRRGVMGARRYAVQTRVPQETVCAWSPDPSFEGNSTQ